MTHKKVWLHRIAAVMALLFSVSAPHHAWAYEVDIEEEDTI